MDPIVGGALVGAVGNIIGGLFGSNSADRANALNEDLAKHGISYRVRDAQAAGIHPLYALNAPTIQASQMINPMGEHIAQAGTQLANAIASQKNKTELVNAQLDIDIKKATLDRINAETSKINSDIVSQQLVSSQARAMRSAVTGAGKPRNSILAGHEAVIPQEKVHALNLPFGMVLRPAPGRTSAQSLEDYYGELGSLIGGIGGFIEDVGHNNPIRKSDIFKAIKKNYLYYKYAY